MDNVKVVQAMHRCRIAHENWRWLEVMSTNSTSEDIKYAMDLEYSDYFDAVCILHREIKEYIDA